MQKDVSSIKISFRAGLLTLVILLSNQVYDIVYVAESCYLPLEGTFCIQEVCSTYLLITHIENQLIHGVPTSQVSSAVNASFYTTLTLSGGKCCFFRHSGACGRREQSRRTSRVSPPVTGRGDLVKNRREARYQQVAGFLQQTRLSKHQLLNAIVLFLG